MTGDDERLNQVRIEGAVGCKLTWNSKQSNQALTHVEDEDSGEIGRQARDGAFWTAKSLKCLNRVF